MKITVAGAGAGKTTNLAEQINKRYQETSAYKHIFCIAYTNNAVKNINQKLKKLFSGEIPKNIHVQTIHSFLYQEIIKPYYYLLFTKKFDHFSFRDKGTNSQYYNYIYSSLEEKNILHVDATTQRAYWVIGQKNTDNSLIKERRKVIQKLFYDYCNSIFIDEAQDIDSYTYKILKTLNKLEININLVGDPKQDLKGYGFFRKLIDEYPNDVSYNNTCHRCPQKIIKLSNLFVPFKEKQKSEKKEGSINVLFESQLDNIAEIINSPTYELKYINKKNETFYTHVIDHQSSIEKMYEIVEEMIQKYKPGLEKNDLIRKRLAYNISRTIIQDSMANIPLSKSIITILGKPLNKTDYYNIANEYNTCNIISPPTEHLIVNSIESIKGCEGKNCLFILTPDLTAYLLKEKATDNKTKSALYVGLTRTLENLTIIITKSTEQAYGTKRITNFFTEYIDH